MVTIFGHFERSVCGARVGKIEGSVDAQGSLAAKGSGLEKTETTTYYTCETLPCYAAFWAQTWHNLAQSSGTAGVPRVGDAIEAISVFCYAE